MVSSDDFTVQLVNLLMYYPSFRLLDLAVLLAIDQHAPLKVTSTYLAARFSVTPYTALNSIRRLKKFGLLRPDRLPTQTARLTLDDLFGAQKPPAGKGR